MIEHRRWLITMVLACLGWPAAGFAQLDSSCMVSALNRTAPVQEDGTWVLPNVPANVGQVRVRATCVKNGVVSFGASSLITVPANGVIKVAEILFEAPPPIPASLSLSASQTVLGTIGQTAQLTALAAYPGGSTADVTLADQGTDYRSSNPAIASVGEDGVVTAHASGVALVSAVNEGALGVLRFEVVTSGDSDGDGLPDDWEISNGLDPNEPVDALDDQDADGLSTVEEYRAGLQPFNPDSDGDGLSDGREVLDLGTQPLLGDTDGDGFWDGLEIQTGSDPLDPDSFNLAAALRSIEVSPASFTLIFNTLYGEASRQLLVTGELIDGRRLDITSRRYGTTYASSDLTIANFGPEDGRVYAGQDGEAVVEVSNGAFRATSVVTVESSAPRPLGWVAIPGFANALALAGDHAYVAAGSEGIQVVDVSDPTAPRVIGSLDTPGNANDIAIEGGFAFVADGFGGLFIADISSPAQPRFVGSLELSGAASGLAVRGGQALVADGLGLRVVDVAVPASPLLLGEIALAGRPSAVSVEGSLALVSSVHGGVQVVDLSNPAQPALLGSTSMRPNRSSGAAGADLRGGLAWVADGGSGLGGLRLVDLRDPAFPFVAGTSSDQFGLTAVRVDGRLALAADYFYPNAVPIFDIGQPDPRLLAVLDFSRAPSFRDDEGHDLEVRQGLVYLVGTACCGTIRDDGDTADSALHIGQYRRPEEEAQPSPPVAALPLVLLTEPADGSGILERRSLLVRAHATDDVRVEFVDFLVDGQAVERDFAPPWEVTVQVPEGATELRLGAVAADTAGNRGTAKEVTVSVLADGNPTVRFLTPRDGSRFTEGGSIAVVAAASDDRALTSVTFSLDGTVLQTFSAPPYRMDLLVPSTPEIRLRATARDDAGQTADAEIRIEVTPDDAPQVWIVEPASERTVSRSALFPVTVGATDDIGVAAVTVFVNGTLRGEDTAAPYQLDLTVPASGNELRLTVVARDTLGQETSVEAVYPIGGGQATTATGLVLLPGGVPGAGAAVTCQGVPGTAAADGRFNIPGLSTTLGRIRCRAQVRAGDGTEHGGISEAVDPVPGGVTDVGQIRLQPVQAFLYPAPQLTTEAEAVEIADLNGDAIPDLVAANPSYGVAVFLGSANGGYEEIRLFETAGSPEDIVAGDFNGDAHLDLATANGGLNGVSVLLGNGDGTFQAHLDTPAESRPVALAAGDFNADGLLDLAVSNETSDTLSILLGNGDGTLVLAQSLPAGDEPVDVVASDVDQDGDLDLLSAQWRSRDVRIFLGDGGGSFTFEGGISMGFTNPDGLTVADLDGDDRPDVAVVSEFGNNVKVFFRAADGTYTPGPTLATGVDPLAVAAGDLDGDGDMDLATANNWSNDLSLFLGDGSGSFGAALQAFTGASPNQLTIGDLDRDGVTDIVTANTSALSLVFGLGTASFDTDRRFAAGVNPQGVAVGDFNGDGAQDLAVASSESDEAAVLLGRGDGTFTAEHRYAVGSGPVDVAVADFNGDGRLDLATADGSADALSVLLGQGDGTFSAPSSLPVGTRPLNLLARDLDGDGKVDLAVANVFSDDVSVLLGQGDGTFAPQARYPVGSGPVSLATGELDGDGRGDLVTANEGDGDVSFLSGHADGSFGSGLGISLGEDPSPFPVSIAVADLDGDGNEDLALTYLIDFSASRYVNGILRGNGDGTFQPLAAAPTGPDPFGPLLIIDANGDGIADLVNANPGGGSSQDVSIALGNGDGSFGEAQRYAVGCGPYNLASGDFNGDGQIDFVTSNGCVGSNDVSILLHH